LPNVIVPSLFVTEPVQVAGVIVAVTGTKVSVIAATVVVDVQPVIASNTATE
jgi:hypothetical protein